MLTDKEKCDAVLLALLASEEQASKWWASRNRAFDMSTPAEMFKVNPNRVLAYLVSSLN